MKYHKIGLNIPSCKYCCTDMISTKSSKPDVICSPMRLTLSIVYPGQSPLIISSHLVIRMNTRADPEASYWTIPFCIDHACVRAYMHPPSIDWCPSTVRQIRIQRERGDFACFSAHLGEVCVRARFKRRLRVCDAGSFRL